MTTKAKGFITFEGIEGCGKSTQASLLARKLRAAGYPCLLTREPGGTRIGREIRQIILDPKHRRMCPETELGLYFADRAQHLREVIWPALEKKTIVVCDRFTDSTLAYQGYGRGLPLRFIRALDRAMTGNFRPQITVLLDLSPEEGLTRARHRNRASKALLREARFEAEQIEFHRRVRSGYLEMSRRESDRFLVIPAVGSKNEVQRTVFQRVVKACRLAGRAS